MPRAIPIDRYRTIGILASQDAGRTTTTERILAIAEPQELRADERAITVTSGATSCDWRGHRLNFIELPGIGRPVDAAAMNAIDAVIVVIDAERGVTPEVAVALAQASSRGLARLVFINKLDRAAVDLDAIVQSIPGGVLLQLPIGAGAGLAGLVDLVGMTGGFWSESNPGDPAEIGAVPAALADQADAARARLVAAAGGAADAVELAQTIRRAVGAGSLVPVLCGSAFRNRGTRRLLDAIVDYLPELVEARAHSADGADISRRAGDDEMFAGFAFRTVNDSASGRLTLLRVYSGAVATGDRAFNPSSKRAERIGPMLRIRARHTETVDEARTGDIVALAGLEHTSSGDTLCDPAAPVILGDYRPRTAA